MYAIPLEMQHFGTACTHAYPIIAFLARSPFMSKSHGCVNGTSFSVPEKLKVYGSNISEETWPFSSHVLRHMVLLSWPKYACTWVSGWTPSHH